MLIDHQYLFVFIFIIFSSIIFSAPCFSFLDVDETRNRNIKLDSLRGFLSIFVVFTHTVAMFYLFSENQWKNPNHKIGYLAGIGVSLFFILTAYLFWDKIKKTENMNWKSLYVKRIFRLVPLIYFQSILSISIILLVSSPKINFANINLLIRESLHWFDFINNDKPEILGYKNSYFVTGGVLWSIVYEWGFYFTLPLLFLLKKKSFYIISALLFIMTYCTDYFFYLREFYYVFLFLIGISSAEFKHFFSDISKKYLDIILLLSIIFILILRPNQIINSYICILFFAIITSIVNGADLFGLLNLKSLQRLGKISFSIYILHPPILFIWFFFSKKYNFLTDISIYCTYIPIMITLLVSCFTYQYIELLFINKSKTLKFK